MDHHFYLKKELTDKLWLLRLRYWAVSQNWMSMKTTDSICCQKWKVKILNENLYFGKLISNTTGTSDPQYLKDFSDISDDTNRSEFLILHNEMCQQFRSSALLNQYFPSDQWCYKIMRGAGREEFKVQARLMDFNITKYELFTDVHILQLIF